MSWDLAELTGVDLEAAVLSGWRVALALDGQLRVPSEPPAMGDAPQARRGTRGRDDSPSPGDHRTSAASRSASTASKAHRYSFELSQVALELSVSATATSVTVRGSLVNHSDEPVALGEVYPVYRAGLSWGEPEDEIAVLPYQGSGEERAYALDDADLPGRSKILAQAWNRTRGTSLQAAFLTFEDVDANVMLGPAGCEPDLGAGLEDPGVGGSDNGSPDRTRDGAGTECCLSACCDFDGWQLPPGSIVDLEVFHLELGADPYAQLEAWADQAAARIQPRLWPDSPHGWLGWSWVDAVNGGETYESVALGNLEAIDRRLGGLGIRYLWTSMSNFAGSQPGNWLEWNDRCIPMGREAFIAAVQERGFVQGFWMGPYYISSALPELVAELEAEDALLRDADGNLLVVCPEWRHGDAGRLPRDERSRLYSLDPTHPRALEFLERVLSTYYGWGVRYYMVDFLEAAAGKLGRFAYDHLYDDSKIPGPQAYRHSLAAIRRAAGDDTFLLSSTGPKIHNTGLIDGVRVGNDLGEGRAITPDSFFYPASYVINNMSFWTAAGYALNCMGAYYHTHRRLFVNNAGNVLTVGQPMPLNEARVMATIHALSGGPSMLGDDIRRLSQERLELIARTLPRSLDTARPLDLFDSLSPVGPRQFVRHIRMPWGEYSVVALFNLSDAPQTVSLRLDELRSGLPNPVNEASSLVFEFWDGRYVGTFGPQITAHVPEESVRVLRIVPASGTPTLLGSDMHVMMGEMEIEDFAYDPDVMVCTVEATRPRGHRGMVFVHAPSALRVEEPDGLHVARDGRDDSLVIGVPLDFGEEERITRQIRFAELDAPLDMDKLDLA